MKTISKKKTGTGKFRLSRPPEQVEPVNRGISPRVFTAIADKVVAGFTMVDESDSGEPVYGVPRSYLVDQTRAAEELRSRTHDLGERVEELERALEIADDKLRLQQVAYREKNVALREVLAEIENDRKQTALQIQANVDRLVGPILRKVEEKINPAEKGYVSLLRNCLSDISSPFVSKLSAQYARLSPREVEVCNLVRHGLTSKEISTNLNISEETVRNQRKSIRRKLGITCHKTNLSTFLQTL